MHDPPLGIGFVNGGKRWGRFSAHPRFVYIFAINRRLNQRISPKRWVSERFAAHCGAKGGESGRLAKGPAGRPGPVNDTLNAIPELLQKHEAVSA